MAKKYTTLHIKNDQIKGLSDSQNCSNQGCGD